MELHRLLKTKCRRGSASNFNNFLSFICFFELVLVALRPSTMGSGIYLVADEAQLDGVLTALSTSDQVEFSKSLLLL